ncbi:glycoside hydrolase superfamily [Mycena polygramma]|nr:glycoside hydrolase superfamily [Mycena polygramma]
MSKDSELREHELTPDEWNTLVMVTSWLKVFRSATATTQTSATKHPLLSTTSTIFRGLWQQIKRGMRPRKACPRSPCQRRRRGLSFQRSHVRKLAGKLDPQKYGAYALLNIQPGNPDFVYQGTLGVDFAANMKISTLDFGTFHMYPDSWGESANDVTWGNQWITDHATVMTAQNKPVIMEEFGLTTATRNASYATWYSTVLSTNLTGDLIWQAGSVLTNGPTPNDGYAIYPTDPVYALMKSHAAALKTRG